MATPAPQKTLASIAAPAPVVSVQPQLQERKQNPKQKAAIDKGLAEVKVERVRVDGLALMKIIKHARESHAVIPAPAGTSNATVSFSPAAGQLLGIDSNGTLEVSNAFALPAGSLSGTSAASEGAVETEGRGVKAATKYTQQLLPRLADLNADASLVGFYSSTNNSQQLAMGGFIEALINAQMSGGGIGSGATAKPIPLGRTSVAVKPAALAGNANKSAKGIALVYDIASASQGHVGIRAYRLSAPFVEAYRAGKFDTQSLIDHKLVPSNILEELPVTIRASPLLTAFLSTLVTPAISQSATPSSTIPLSPISSFSALSLPLAPTNSLTTPISALLSALDTHQAHLSTLSFLSRQLARDRARNESLNPIISTKKLENEQRVRDGLVPLEWTPEEKEELEKERGMEPSRLETMCALNGVEGAARVLSEQTGAMLVKSYGSRAGTAVV